jgi:beta-glucosidase
MQLKTAARWLLLVLTVRAAPADKIRQLNKRALAHSDPFYPSPWMDPNADGWQAAYAKAKEFVSQMTLMEKVNLTTGVGYVLLVQSVQLAMMG